MYKRQVILLCHTCGLEHIVAQLLLGVGHIQHKKGQHEKPFVPGLQFVQDVYKRQDMFNTAAECIIDSLMKKDNVICNEKDLQLGTEYFFPEIGCFE